MIRSCFNVFSGIGPKREQEIKAAGISNWQQFLDAGEMPGLSKDRRRSVARQIKRWSTALDEGDVRFLARNVPRSAHWSLFGEFRDSVRYLDIETTGLSPGHDDVTVVGIYDGRNFKALINGQDLCGAAIQEALDGCKLLVSYYGTVFDVPFLKAAFPDLHWDLPHYDLCFAGRKVGLRGGLKGVERQLGIVRGADISEVDGFEAVRLWRAYQRGQSGALRKLVRYNEADTKNLARIASTIHERLCEAR